jgi:5-(carboxyamino)imidazole ribonucleotide synthase
VSRSTDDVAKAPAHLFPGVLKASRLGYDGKGQVRVNDQSDTRRAFVALGEVPCVLEQRLSLAFEISVVLARTVERRVVTFPVAENIHRDGILHVTRVPSPRVSAAIAERAIAAAIDIANALDYRGVLCVEFFVLTNGDLIVNEMAPRPHNSGHYTIDACETSQFDAQVRVMTQAPLGSTAQHSAAVMLNVLGDLWFTGGQEHPLEPDWEAVLKVPGANLHLYGKNTPRRARKMGHITLVGQDPKALWDRAAALARHLGMPDLPVA